MSKIEILSEVLANQIAAGEVVERPASVVKELVENSIDAGAAKISVEIELGGRRLIKVTDDGSGIAREDAVLAFSRHATSKLKSLEQLESITTLGFRGEALASISSVARVSMSTKTVGEEAATLVESDGGTEFKVTDTARTNGTTITVRELFYNTPARRKFLRSQPTENFHIASIVTHYALANPEIAFTLLNNGRESIRVTPARNLRERAYQLFGNDLIESLVPVLGHESKFVSVDGFVSAPRERRTSRDAQYFFINGRYVKDRVLSMALSEGYRSVLPHGVYPVAFLFIDLPPEEVDVNVHPSKTEVRFRRAEAVKEAVSHSVKTALGKAGIGRERQASFEIAEPVGPELKEPGEEELALYAGAAADIPAPARFDFGTIQNREAEENRTEIPVGFEYSGEVTDVPDTPYAPAKNVNLPPVDDASSIPKSVEIDDIDPSRIRPIGQLHSSFIIASDEKGLLLIDQHVAHERILFDKFRKRETERPVESQNLLIPETIDLTHAQFEAFGELSEQLEEFGFGIRSMSGRTLAIQSVPIDIPAGEVRNLLSEILETVDPTAFGNADYSIRDSIAATMACKAAVKINMELTEEKMRWMIDNLLLTSSPSTCPHGRPVVLRLTMKDIERRFHRT